MSEKEQAVARRKEAAKWLANIVSFVSLLVFFGGRLDALKVATEWPMHITDHFANCPSCEAWWNLQGIGYLEAFLLIVVALGSQWVPLITDVLARDGKPPPLKTIQFFVVFGSVIIWGICFFIFRRDWAQVEKIFWWSNVFIGSLAFVCVVLHFLRFAVWIKEIVVDSSKS